MSGPSHLAVRDTWCPECGAAPGVPCTGTRYAADGHHADRIIAASGTSVVAPARRPYDRTLEEQRAIPPGHEEADPRADEPGELIYTPRQVALGLTNLPVVRALLAEHKATKVGGIVGQVERVDAAFIANARAAAARWHAAGCPAPARLEVDHDG